MGVDCIALTKKYFEVWNAHDVPGITALHAATSSLADWDASHGPTNEAVGKGIEGIWKAVPDIKIEIIDVYTVSLKVVEKSGAYPFLPDPDCMYSPLPTLCACILCRWATSPALASPTSRSLLMPTPHSRYVT